MSILNQLSTSLNRRDEVPNQELAKKIIQKNDTKAVKELIENLFNKNKDIQIDCIKVLYEIGARKPGLIEEYSNAFIDLLDHKNNRLQWGAMTAIDYITLENPKNIYASLSNIIDAANNGSVITKDHAVNILIKLCSIKLYSDNSFALLNEQLLKSPTNQLPKYAEDSLPIINLKNKKIFLKTLRSRINDVEKETKKKRIEKVISKVEKIK